MTEEEALLLAEASGVSYKKFRWRLEHGWTPEEATVLKNPKTKRMKERLRRMLDERNGKNTGDSQENKPE